MLLMVIGIMMIIQELKMSMALFIIGMQYQMIEMYAQKGGV